MLVRLAYLLAPFTPFLAEELYHNLTGDDESIHLKDWLPAGSVNELVMNDMENLRDLVNRGLSVRAKAGIKVRQPLREVSVPDHLLSERVNAIEVLCDELNVKSVMTLTDVEEVELDTEITPELKREGLMREVIRHVQSARKAAGLNVDDHIVLSLTSSSSSELEEAVAEHSKTIADETLADRFANVEGGYDTTVNVEGAELRICLKKT